MKRMKYGLLGLFAMAVVVVMPLRGVASEDGEQPRIEELAKVDAEINDYVASLSLEDQAEFYRAVAEIEKEYGLQQAAEGEMEESIGSGD